jgi:hypothetical protein
MRQFIHVKCFVIVWFQRFVIVASLLQFCLQNISQRHLWRSECPFDRITGLLYIGDLNVLLIAFLGCYILEIWMSFWYYYWVVIYWRSECPFDLITGLLYSRATGKMRQSLPFSLSSWQKHQFNLTKTNNHAHQTLDFYFKGNNFQFRVELYQT